MFGHGGGKGGGFGGGGEGGGGKGGGEGGRRRWRLVNVVVSVVVVAVVMVAVPPKLYEELCTRARSRGEGLRIVLNFPRSTACSSGPGAVPEPQGVVDEVTLDRTNMPGVSAR